MSHGEKQSRFTEQAISALLTYPTVSEAAQSISVCPRTLCRWMRDPEFAEQFREERREVMRIATARLQVASTVAVNVHVEVMSDKSVPAGSRVAAARTILEMATRATELEDLEMRVANLEEQKDESSPPSPALGTSDAWKDNVPEKFRHRIPS